jgi:hypothetical protein
MVSHMVVAVFAFTTNYRGAGWFEVIPKLRPLHATSSCNLFMQPLHATSSCDLFCTRRVCTESNGLLRSFAGYISSTGINADVVHLFQGKDFTGTNSIGCAYIGTICDARGYNVGVNK